MLIKKLIKFYFLLLHLLRRLDNVDRVVGDTLEVADYVKQFRYLL